MTARKDDCGLDITIRAASRSDFSSIAKLQADSWRSAYRNHLPPTYLRAQVDTDLAAIWQSTKVQPDDILLVAQAMKETPIVGFVSVWCRPSPFIDHLHVSPHLTSSGIGGTLFRTALSMLKARGHNTASLTVLVGNDRARQFYLRHGGEPSTIRREEIFSYPVKSELIIWPDLQSLTWPEE